MYRHLATLRSQMRAVFFGLTMTFICPTTNAENLLDIYRLALLNDPTFEVARYSLQVEMEKYPQAFSGFLPTVSLSGTNNLSEVENQFSNASNVQREVHAWNWSLEMTQPLIRIQNLYSFKEAKMVVEQAQAQYSLAQQDMILRIAQSYFSVMSAQEEIKVIEAELAAVEEQLTQANRGFEKGVAAITDVLEARSRANLARANLLSTKNEYDAKIAELEKIVDVVPAQLDELSPDAIIPPPVPSDAEYWVTLAHKNNPAVKVAHYGLLASEASVGRARSQHAPTLDLVASYSENYSSGNATIPNDYSTRGRSTLIGIKFTVPIYSGGGTASMVSEARANKYRAGAELEVAKRQSSTDARMAYSGMINGLSKISALESLVESGQSMVDQSHVGYGLGVYNNFKVLDAEQSLYAAKRDLVKARYEMLFQVFKLKASVGTLSEDDLVSANALLVH